MNRLVRLRPLPHTIAQVIEGEAIVINLTSGVYYSLEGPGAFAWELLAGGATPAAAAEAVARRYDVDAETARGDVERLGAQLLDEGLCEHANGDGQASVVVPGDGDGNGRLPYGKLELHAYRDMAALLALDPPMPGLEDI